MQEKPKGTQPQEVNQQKLVGQKANSPEDKPLFSATASSTPEKGPAEEQKFEITEREKYLLEVMAHVIAQGYIPSLGTPGKHGYWKEELKENKQALEGILRHRINKSTKVTDS